MPQHYLGAHLGTFTRGGYDSSPYLRMKDMEQQARRDASVRSDHERASFVDTEAQRLARMDKERAFKESQRQFDAELADRVAQRASQEGIAREARDARQRPGAVWDDKKERLFDHLSDQLALAKYLMTKPNLSSEDRTRYKQEVERLTAEIDELLDRKPMGAGPADPMAAGAPSPAFPRDPLAGPAAPQEPSQGMAGLRATEGRAGLAGPPPIPAPPPPPSAGQAPTEGMAGLRSTEGAQDGKGPAPAAPTDPMAPKPEDKEARAVANVVDAYARAVLAGDEQEWSRLWKLIETKDAAKGAVRAWRAAGERADMLPSAFIGTAQAGRFK
jgi:hypothetical protein